MTWSVFDTWRPPPAGLPAGPPNWRALEPLAEKARDFADEEVMALRGLIQSWNARLAVLGGDPLLVSWASFRPLRLNREEAWSDWLAFLLQASTTGTFERHLLGDALMSKAPGPIAPLVARRELSTEGGEYRADILLERRGRFAHIEVKVGDQHFEKTFPTARKLREAHGRGALDWTDRVLLLEDDVDQWMAVAARSGSDKQSAGSANSHGEIRAITWSHVAIGLRRSILAEQEPLHWRVWAWSFTGAIEQRLLGHVAVDGAGSVQGERDVLGHLEIITRMRTFLHGVDET